MSGKYDDSNTGVLFKNNKKTKPNQPDLTGRLFVGDREYRLAAWKRQPKAGGDTFLSIRISDPDEKRGAPREERREEPAKQEELNDDIPW